MADGSEYNPEYVRGFVIEIVGMDDSISDCGNEKRGVGNGFLIYPDSKIITCTHVLKEAGVNLEEKESAQICIRFPDWKSHKREMRKAKIVAFLDDDDVALLKLIDEPSPLGPEKLALLGIVDRSRRHHFISFGWKYIHPKFPGLFADGTIMGELSPERILQINSEQVDTGMSGSPVVVVDNNKFPRVVGVIASTFYPDEGGKNPALSYAVDTQIFKLDPFKGHIQIYDVIPFQIGSLMPKADMSIASSVISPNLNLAIDNAPPIPDHWVERIEPMKAITDSWKDETIKMISIIGPDGVGKTSLVNKFLRDVLIQRDIPKAVFWWSFKDNPIYELFFETALEYITGGKSDTIPLTSTNDKMDFLAAIVHIMSKQEQCLFILDDLNEIQHHQGDEYGYVKNEELKKFVSYLSRFGRGIAISNIPLRDLMGHSGHIQHSMTFFSKEEGRELLRKIGVHGSDEDLDEVVKNCDGNLKMIAFSGILCVNDFEGNVEKIKKIFYR